MNRQPCSWNRGKEVTGSFFVVVDKLTVKIPQGYSSLFFFTFFLFSNGPLLPCRTKVLVFFSFLVVTCGRRDAAFVFFIFLWYFFFYYYSPQWQAGATWRAADSQSSDLLVLESGRRQWTERVVRVCVCVCVAGWREWSGL